MATKLRPQEAAFKASLDNLSPMQLVPELRRVLAAARPLPYYVGSAALALLTCNVAEELAKREVYVEALPLFREALAEFTATLGADNHDTAEVASSLGHCLHVLGQNEEALPLLERACLTFQVGMDKKLALYTLGILAGVRRALGNLVGAEALLKQGLATLSRLAVTAGLAPDAPPPGLLKEWSNVKLYLAQLHEESSRFEDAELLLRGSLATLAGLPVCDETAETVTMLTGELACVLRRRGDLLGAEQMYRELLPKFQGKSNYSVTAHNLGTVLRDRGLVTESRKYLDIAQEADSVSLGADNSITQKSRQNRSNLEASLRACARCGPITDDAVVMKVCQGCKAARYCSHECSLLHWKAHKVECKRIKAENEQIAGGAGASTAGSAGSLGE